jgi:hypothetical protein
MDQPTARQPAAYVPETSYRFCPGCYSLAVLPLGRVVAGADRIRSDYRCRECAREFVLVR